MTTHWPAWSARSVYEVDGARSRIVRRVAWTYHGAQPAEVANAVLRVPALRLDGHAANFYLLPAAWPARQTSFGELRPGRCCSESSWLTGQSGIIVAHAPKAGLSTFVGHELSLDGATAGIEEGKGWINLCHHLNTAGRIQPGQTWEVGVQHIQIVTGDWSDALRALADFSDTLGNGPPADSPAWLDRCVVYSCYPRGPIDVSFNGGGGFATFTRDLDHLARLGVNTLWLNPTYTDPPGVYGIHDHRAIARSLGTTEDLRRFVTRAHELKQRVWFDLVSHGPAKDSPDARQASPDAWARNRDGSLCLSWGNNLTGDYSHPAWQAYMSDVAAYWVERFGVDGYRHDCGFGSSGLNWSPTAPFRPSASAPFGGVMLTNAVRQRIRRFNPDAAIFSETGGPLFFRSADLIYDYPFYLACRELTYGTTATEWIPRMRRWLQLSQATYPRQALGRLVRFVENHDTVRASEYFGVGPAQALTALAIFSRGTPMIYQEQEVGLGPLLREWLDIRNRLPELRTGSADYESVSSSAAGVFALLRRTSTGASVVAVNLTGRSLKTDLAWPADLAAQFPIGRCADTSRPVPIQTGRCTIEIAPYGAVVVALRPAPDDLPRPAARFASSASTSSAGAGGGSLVLSETTKLLPGGATEYRLRIHPVRTWSIATGEGLLNDEFVDRYRPGPLPTLDVCWRPFANGLWDTCSAASIGFGSADGRRVRIERIRVPELIDARIEDDTHVGRNVQVVLTACGAGGRPYELVEASSTALPLGLDVREFPVAEVGSSPQLIVDPFYVTAANRHYHLRLARRHGGTIAALAMGGKWLPLAGLTEVASDVYTDWGLYPKGQYAGTRDEPKPSLAIRDQGAGKEVTFTGRLKGYAWNGVQRGHPWEPAACYRLTYGVEGSSAVRLTLGLTSRTDHPGAQAFFAFRWSVRDVLSWSAILHDHMLSGHPGAKPGQRVFESTSLKGSPGDWSITLTTTAGKIQVRPSKGAAIYPQNVFLLDGAADTMSLFIALLNGGPIDLKAGREHAATLEVLFEPNSAP